MDQSHGTVNPTILVDGRALLEPAYGGVFEYASRLTAALKASGRFDVRTWANAARVTTAPAGVDILTRRPNKFVHASMRFMGGHKIDRMAGMRPDLLWLPNPHFFSASPDFPLVLTLHDLSSELYPEFFSPKQRLRHHLVDSRGLARRADRLLAVSETTKRDIVERWNIRPEKITVTPEGAAPELFDSPSQDDLDLIRARRRLPKRFILHVGAMEPRKNHLALLDAYHQLRPQARFSDVGLVLAGPAGWNNAAILRTISRSPYRDHILMLGHVSDEERRALYRLAAVLAFPSFYEGFGLPPLEAMASGLPVVASHAAATSEIVGNAGLLTDPYRPSELADALAAILDSPSLSALYTARGRDRAGHFTWEICAKKTEEAFADVLSKSKAAQPVDTF